MVSGGQGDSGWIHTIAFSGAESAFYSVDYYGKVVLYCKHKTEDVRWSHIDIIADLYFRLSAEYNIL